MSVVVKAEGSLRVGFLGAGLIATYHSKMLRRFVSEIRVPLVRAGVYDPDPELSRAFAAASGHQALTTEQAVIDGCDVVYVCTWTSEHPRLVAMAAAQGKAIFCEKPLATTLVDAIEMERVVRAAGVVNQVGLVLRHSPVFNMARELVHAPEAGRVMSVVFRDDQFIPIQGHYASDWRADVTKAGAGTLLEHSIHDLDLLEFVVGPISAVSGRTANFHGLPGIEDVATAQIEFRSGAMGSLTSLWHDNLSRPSLRRIEIFCERRLVTVEGDWDGPIRWQDADGHDETLVGDALIKAATPIVEAGFNPDVAFLRAVQRGEFAQPDMAIAVRAQRIADAIYRSAANEGGRVKVG